MIKKLKKLNTPFRLICKDLGKLKYFITLPKIEYESLICKAFVMGGVPGLVLIEGIHSFQVITDMKAARKKIPEAKRKRKVKCRYYRPRSQYYYISVLYTMINTQTIG